MRILRARPPAACGGESSSGAAPPASGTRPPVGSTAGPAAPVVPPGPDSSPREDKSAPVPLVSPRRRTAPGRTPLVPTWWRRAEWARGRSCRGPMGRGGGDRRVRLRVGRRNSTGPASVLSCSRSQRNRSTAAGSTDSQLLRSTDTWMPGTNRRVRPITGHSPRWLTSVTGPVTTIRTCRPSRSTCTTTASSGSTTSQ